MSKKFKHLNLSPHWQQYFSKYPQGYTIIENLIDWVSQVDDMVDNQNTLNVTVNTFGDRLDEFIGQYDTHLQETIEQTLSDWQNSGFLDVVIDSALETKYHEMDERLTAQLGQNGRFLSNYYDLVEDNDYRTAIQTAIDDLYEEDGGTLYLPDNSDLRFGQPLHIKENVMLKGGKNTRLLYTNEEDLIPVVMHKRSGHKNTTWIIPKNHNNAIFLIDSDVVIADNPDTKDKSSGVKMKIEDFRIYSDFTPTTTKKTAFKFTSKGGGIWDIQIKDGSIRGANTVFDLETIGQGWINGMVFRDIVILDSEQVVKTTKSAESLGIDYNIFDHLVIQANQYSKTLFDDPNNNTYLNTEVYDLHVFTQGKLGYTKNSIGSIRQNVGVKEMLGSGVYENQHYHLGTFLRESSSQHAQFTFIEPRIDIHSLITVRANGEVIRKHLGRTPLDETTLKFHRKTNENETVDLYVTTTISRDLSLFINERHSFSPTFGSYQNLTGLTEITNNTNQVFHYNHEEIDSETNYTKFPDGTMIIRGFYENSSVELISDDSVTGIKLLKGADVTYPQEFIATPTVTTTSQRDFLPISVKITSNTSKGFTPYLYANSANLSSSQMFHYIAIGRWK